MLARAGLRDLGWAAAAVPARDGVELLRSDRCAGPRTLVVIILD
jgi:hypothetical protein